MTLAEHRAAIDQLDQKILKLLNERTKHVLEIGSIKLKMGEEIYAPHRELAVLERLCRMNEGPITNDSVKAIYREIMSSALSLEKSMTIAYLGPEWSFTHEAAIRRFGSSLKYAAQTTITNVFAEISKGRADYGVVPIESSTEGIVTHTLDMFVESDLKIVAQIVLPIKHCLVSKAPLKRIKKVYGTAQLIEECRSWLQTNLPKLEIVETLTTSKAAQKAATTKNTAALASPLTAEHFGLDVVEIAIQEQVNSSARFLVLGRQCSPPTGNDRTSLMLGLPQDVASLHRALKPLEKFKLSRIESRPDRWKPTESFFFVDCEGHQGNEELARALAEVQAHARFLKVLGSYPNAS